MISKEIYDLVTTEKTFLDNFYNQLVKYSTNQNIVDIITYALNPPKEEFDAFKSLDDEESPNLNQIISENIINLINEFYLEDCEEIVDVEDKNIFVYDKMKLLNHYFEILENEDIKLEIDEKGFVRNLKYANINDNIIIFNAKEPSDVLFAIFNRVLLNIARSHRFECEYFIDVYFEKFTVLEDVKRKYTLKFMCREGNIDANSFIILMLILNIDKEFNTYHLPKLYHRLFDKIYTFMKYLSKEDNFIDVLIDIIDRYFNYKSYDICLHYESNSKNEDKFAIFNECKGNSFKEKYINIDSLLNFVVCAEYELQKEIENEKK